MSISIILPLQEELNGEDVLYSDDELEVRLL